ncbi:hypothetical protein Ancab_006007 [Ancistrocladus abbreviatus]
MESRLEIRTKSGKAESEEEEGREVLEPVSPTGQYFSSSVLSVSILAILEFDAPIDESYPTIPFLQDAFLPINPRFSSIMTVNDVIIGITFLGARLYMQEKDIKSQDSCSTLLVLLNTRNVNGYKSVKEMMTVGTKAPWGNHIAFLQVSVPKSSNGESFDPLKFVLRAQKKHQEEEKFYGCPSHWQNDRDYQEV